MKRTPSWSKLTVDEQKQLRALITSSGMMGAARALQSTPVTLEKLSYGGLVGAKVIARIRENLGQSVVPTEIRP